ncbi:MAG: HAMP domain-containing protein [Candidatus Riflebacteria bacterium]|nr:HAMP domain-containing protein [Candidatus Riflebacteria bacterium]
MTRMPARGWQGFLTGLLFLLPFLVVHVSMDLTEQEEAAERFRETEQANLTDLDRVTRSLTPAHFLGTALKHLEFRLATGIRARLAAGRPPSPGDLRTMVESAMDGPEGVVIRRFGAELVVVRSDRAGTAGAGGGHQVVWREGAARGLQDLPAEAFDYLLEPGQTGPEGAARVEVAFRRLMGFPVVVNAFRDRCWGACGEYTNEHGTWGFFWEEVPLPPGAPDRLLVTARASLLGLGERVRWRLATLLWDSWDGDGPSADGPPVVRDSGVSRGPPRRQRGSPSDLGPAAPGALRQAGAGRGAPSPQAPPTTLVSASTGGVRRDGAALAILPGGGQGTAVLSNTWRRSEALRGWRRGDLPAPGASAVVGGGHLVTRQADPDGGAGSLVLARPLPPGRSPLFRAVRLAASFVYVALVVLGVVQLILFERRQALPLRLLFGLLFLLAVLTPLTGVYHLASRQVGQTFREDQKSARDALRRRFKEIDDGQTEHSAGVMSILQRALQAPSFLAQVRAGEDEWRRTGRGRRLGALLQGFFRRIRNPDHPIHRLPDGTLVPLSRVLGFFLVGPDRLAEFQNNERIPTSVDIRKFFEVIGQRALEVRNPALRREGPARPPGRVDRAAMLLEYGSQMLINLAGYEAFLDLVYKPSSLVAARVGAVRQTFFQTTLRIDGVARFVALLVWLEMDQDHPYLLMAMQSPLRPGEPVVYPVDRMNRTFLAAPPDLPVPIREAAFQALETGLPVSSFDRRTGLLVEAAPCRNLNRHVLVGSQPIAPLVERMTAGRRRFWLGLAVVVGLAVLSAAGGAAVFLLPLQAIVRAFRAVREGRFETRLELRERDEFGSVAEAFNALAQGLQEGRLLGRFVSEPVRQAARAGNLEMLAGAAREIETTVVFAGLGGFEEVRRVAPVDELAAILEDHLEIASRAAARAGGEIDKLFGEKIMVVFDHQRFDHPAQAARAALAFAREVRGAFGGHGRLRQLSAKIGINSGPALLGFLGSPAVRLDHTVIGDTVNLASRLASLAHTLPGGQIVVAGQTLALAGETGQPRPLAVRQVRGKTRQVEVFQLDGRSGAAG